MNNLVDVLQETKSYLLKSEESAFAAQTPTDLIWEIDRILLQATSGQRLNPDEIKMLFVPTGALQDTAIDNGWGDAFLALAEQADSLSTNLR